MWKLKDEALGQKKWELMAELKFRLEALRGRIPEIRFLQVGLNVVKADTASDLVLVSDFDDMEALNRYAGHPEHLKVADFVKQVTSERRAVDFEFL
jgi:hypothetical protein